MFSGVELTLPSIPIIPPFPYVPLNASAGMLSRTCFQRTIRIRLVKPVPRGQGHRINGCPSHIRAHLGPVSALGGRKRGGGPRAGKQVIRPLSLNYVQCHESRVRGGGICAPVSYTNQGGGCDLIRNWSDLSSYKVKQAFKAGYSYKFLFGTDPPYFPTI